MIDSTETSGTSETDINDVFDSILLSEGQVSESGFKEGFNKGSKEGELEGYHLGYHRGAELGAEIGFYNGVAEILQKIVNVDEIPHRHVEAITKLKKLLELFPIDNDSSLDIIALRDNIRAQYKRVCALLKIDSSLPEDSKLSF